jgi:hypothetical protein
MFENSRSGIWLIFFCASANMLSELNVGLNHSVFMGGAVKLDLVYECCDLSIEHSRAILQLLKISSGMINK